MKDTSVIPKGDYCYTWKEVPSESNNYRGTVNLCSYYDVKNVNGVEFPWCNYLELGGTPGDGNWAGWEDSDKADDILNKHFGSTEETEKHLPLFLLFDGCKECGENVEDEP
jgi:hypothetical protein